MAQTSQSLSTSEAKRKIKEYICGDFNCKKRYGTNAALYTHIKNKHLGITPIGTKRPSSEQIKGRKGRPQQLKSEKKQIDNLTEEKIKIVKIMSTEKFQDFVYMIGQIGDHELIRDQEDEYQYIKEDDIEKIKNDSVLVYQSRLDQIQKQKNNINNFLYNHLHFGNINTFIGISKVQSQTNNELKQRAESNEQLALLNELIQSYPNQMQITQLQLGEL